MFKRLLCWLGFHNYKFIEYHNFYKGDLGFTEKCNRCGKIHYSNGRPIW